MKIKNTIIINTSKHILGVLEIICVSEKFLDNLLELNLNWLKTLSYKFLRIISVLKPNKF